MLGLGQIMIVRVSDDLPCLYEDITRGTSSCELTVMSFDLGAGFIDFHTEPPGLRFNAITNPELTVSWEAALEMVE